ncbi:mesoderm posterior protein 1-like [Chiloscyllium plagiosum]|uniref:mesoderm posterior protein 1-like n=1 Tax=Chiloscyllium plagiosum TaxID=36176 RepID=UPI001CB8177A|nr:mesoderm posterior protein 1-like [Chiloscyllium plagiosum]
MEIPVPQYQDCMMFENNVDCNGISDCSSIIPELGCEAFSYWICIPSESDSSRLSDWNPFSSESDCLTDSTAYSLSPVSSIDSCRFSPPILPHTPGSETHGSSCEARSLPSPPTERPGTSQRLRKTRPRYPGKQRQSASEREKLRMRGLAKALHNLRTYLPPSVVPASQSLTKLETLRLTIRYISHLTELLRLSEERPSEGSDTEGTYQGYPQDLGYCQDKSQSPPSECLTGAPHLFMNNESCIPADFQDRTLCQSFTENTESAAGLLVSMATLGPHRLVMRNVPY